MQEFGSIRLLSPSALYAEIEIIAESLDLTQATCLTAIYPINISLPILPSDCYLMGTGFALPLPK
jgi:hypothetical protein